MLGMIGVSLLIATNAIAAARPVSQVLKPLLMFCTGPSGSSFDFAGVCGTQLVSLGGLAATSNASEANVEVNAET